MDQAVVSILVSIVGFVIVSLLGLAVYFLKELHQDFKALRNDMRVYGEKQVSHSNQLEKLQEVADDHEDRLRALEKHRHENTVH